MSDNLPNEASPSRTAASMEPSTVAKKPPKPPKWWLLVTLAAGSIGSLAGVTAGASGVYDIPPFTVSMSAKIAPAGETVFEVKPAQLSPGRAEAGTHAGPLLLNATVTDVDPTMLPSDAAAAATPSGMADYMAENGKSAMTAFAIKTIIVGLLGSLLGGLAISFGRWRRVVGALVAGALTVGSIGALAAVTYDKDEFKKTQFQRSAPESGLLNN